MTDRPGCRCHGEPMHFRHDSRYRAGGFYTCAVKGRAYTQAYYAANAEAVCAQKRERYDTDPIHRIEKRLADDRRKRRKTIERNRRASDGSLQEQRRDRPAVEPHPQTHHP